MSVTPDVAIRDASPAERAIVAELTARAYQEYASVMEPDAWVGLSDALHSTLAADRGAEWIVAELNGKLVGSVLLVPPHVDTYGTEFGTLEWPEVRLLAVVPEARGQGIAKALMSECLERAAAAGATHLGLHTSRSMRVAIEMYRRMGFVRAPAYDFQTPGGELVEAFILDVPPA